MNTDRIIYITCYWNDEHPSESFERTCVVWGKGSPKDVSCNESAILADEEVFFYFDYDQDILGPQSDFTVIAYEEEDGYIPS